MTKRTLSNAKRSNMSSTHKNQTRHAQLLRDLANTGAKMRPNLALQAHRQTSLVMVTIKCAVNTTAWAKTVPSNHSFSENSDIANINITL